MLKADAVWIKQEVIALSISYLFTGELEVFIHCVTSFPMPVHQVNL